MAYLWWNLHENTLTLGLIWTICGIGYLLIITKGFREKPRHIEFEETIYVALKNSAVPSPLATDEP